MELLSAYIYSNAPMQLTMISQDSLIRLKDIEWFEDERTPDRFKLLNKRFLIDNIWYRVVLRFKKAGEVLELDTPIPFAIIQTEIAGMKGSVQNVAVQFKDVRVWHGNTIKQTHNFIREGVPAELIDTIMQELRENLIYQDGKKNKKQDFQIKLDLTDQEAASVVRQGLEYLRSPYERRVLDRVMGLKADRIIVDEFVDIDLPTDNEEE